jgi:hypothetical protein
VRLVAVPAAVHRVAPEVVDVDRLIGSTWWETERKK